MNALKEAEDEFRKSSGSKSKSKSKSSNGSKTKVSDAQKEKEQKKRVVAGRRKLQKAAGTWADPLLRTFLLAVAAYESEDYLRSAALFKRLAKRAPSVPAFQQGYAMALKERKNYDDALVAYMNLVRLCPDSSEVLKMLSQAISEVPGNRIETKTFKQAKKMRERYSTSSRSRGTSRRSSTRRRSSWLLPGGKVTARENSLPVPPMDRLSFYQAIAVPVSEHILLVDRKIVADAEQVVIRLDADTMVFAKVKTSRRNKDMPFAMLEVAGYKFTPVEISQTAEMGTGGLFATALGINCLEEMGSKVRTVPVKAKSISSEGRIEVSAGLWPGESAGPVFDSKGKFVGFLAGNTDPNTDKSSNLLYTQKDLEALLKRAKPKKKRSRKTSLSKRKAKPRAVKGNSFIIQAVISERFEDE